jgi:hypothetical protein
MTKKSMILPAVVIGLGAVVGLTYLHFSQDSRGDGAEQASRRASDIVSPFASAAPAGSESAPVSNAPKVARVDAPARTELPAERQRQPESDADPADVPTAPENFPTYDQSTDQLSEEHTVPAEKSGLVDANARAEALREIDTTSPNSFPVLEQTLRSDPTSRNRLIAVSSLRLLGKQAGNAERARQALRLAMTDADENVRTNAQDAYEELAR